MAELVIKTELIVDSILNKRISSEGKIEYNVRWIGHSNGNNTWDTAENLNCPELLESFNAEWEDLTDDESTSIPITDFKIEPELLIECDGSTYLNNEIDIFNTISKPQSKQQCMICSFCDKPFKHYSNLVRHLRIHKNLKPYLCDYKNCGKRFRDSTALVVHKRIHTGEKPYQCEVCPSKFSTSGGLRLHSNVHLTDKQFVCHFCNKKFVTQSYCSRHVKAVHKDGYVKPVGERKCSFCFKKFASPNACARHVRIHTGERPFECLLCKKLFRGLADLKIHLRTHSNERPYECDTCDKRFTTSNSLYIHKQTHSEDRPYACPICGRQFKTKGDCRKHTNTHNDEKSFQCKLCDKKFRRLAHVRSHMNSHNRVKDYECDVCKKTFASLQSIRYHMGLHSGFKELFECGICSKTFTRSTNYRSHLYIHSDTKQFKCNICFKSFKRNSNLSVHLRTHSSIKNYKCTVCDKAFNRKHHKDTHERLHTSVRPYSCQYCEKRFNQLADKNTHEHVHTGEKPFKCTYCDKKFSRSSDRGKHEAVSHMNIKKFKCDVCLKCFGYRHHLKKHAKSHTPKLLENNKIYRSNKYNHGILSTIINTGSFSIDTYFFLSGVSITYTFYKTIKNMINDHSIGAFDQVIHFAAMILHKVLRLIFPYLVVLLTLQLIMKYYYHHSVVEIPSQDHVTCQENMWKNMLFIDTFFPIHERCMPWSWYFSLDCQFFVAASIILLIANNHPRYATVICMSFFISSFVTTTIVRYNKRPKTSLTYEEQIAEFNSVYDQPWVRIAPFLLGMCLGYILFKTKEKMNLNIFVIIAGWIATVLLICGITFRKLFLIKSNLWIESSLSSITHTVWPMILFWIILTSVSQYQGFLGRFLSSNYLIPVSKLSNCILLIHPLITRIIVLDSEQTFHLSLTILVTTYVGFVVLSVFAGFVLYMFFEAPLTALLQNVYHKSFK